MIHDLLRAAAQVDAMSSALKGTEYTLTPAARNSIKEVTPSPSPSPALPLAWCCVLPRGAGARAAYPWLTSPRIASQDILKACDERNIPRDMFKEEDLPTKLSL